jgi:hypothetical protein
VIERAKPLEPEADAILSYELVNSGPTAGRGRFATLDLGKDGSIKAREQQSTRTTLLIASGDVDGDGNTAKIEGHERASDLSDLLDLAAFGAIAPTIGTVNRFGSRAARPGAPPFLGARIHFSLYIDRPAG